MSERSYASGQGRGYAALISARGSDRIVKMGEDVTETLEVIPRQWKVIQTVREKFTCRHCEKISQAPAPFHPTPRGWAGRSLLAMILFEKFGQHQPLNRQAERRRPYAARLDGCANLQGMRSSMRDLGWPSRMTRRVEAR
jgi:transposase